MTVTSDWLGHIKKHLEAIGTFFMNLEQFLGLRLETLVEVDLTLDSVLFRELRHFQNGSGDI